MMLFMVFLIIALLLLAIMIAAVRPAHSRFSTFELNRRLALTDPAAKTEARRQHAWPLVVSLQRTIVLLLVAAIVMCLIGTFGWGWGSVGTVVLGVFFYHGASFVPLRNWSNKLYHQYEQPILDFLHRHEAWLRYMRSYVPPVWRHAPASRQEVLHIVQESGNLLTADEKQRISHGLAFDSTVIRDIMTPRAAIDTVNHDDLLGPLVLNDLHQTGHTIFPVINGDVDAVVGMVHLDKVVVMREQQSVTAQDAMTDTVCYVRDDYTLEQAMAAFLRTKQPLMIVIDGAGATVGVVSIDDVIKATLGRGAKDAFSGDTSSSAVVRR